MNGEQKIRLNLSFELGAARMKKHPELIDPIYDEIPVRVLHSGAIVRKGEANGDEHFSAKQQRRFNKVFGGDDIDFLFC